MIFPTAVFSTFQGRGCQRHFGSATKKEALQLQNIVKNIKLQVHTLVALRQNSASELYGTSPAGITWCYLPPDTSERAPP